MVRQDAVLTAEVLRIVNSAYFGMTRRVSTIAHAVTIIGDRALRNVVLCISVRDVLRRNDLPGFDAASFAEEALRRAVCARCLAKTVGGEPEEAFTVGLLQDLGTLVLFYAKPHRAPRWRDIRRQAPGSRLEVEAELFGTTHDRLAEAIGEAWQLPDEFIQAIRAHHGTGIPVEAGRTGPTLARLAAAADWMAAVFSADDRAAALTRCKEVLADRFGLDGTSTERLLGAVADAMAGAAQDLGLTLAEQPPIDELLREANLRLAEENLSYQELTWRLQRTLAERDRLAAALAKELELAREIQQSLLPAPLSDPPLVGAVNIPARQVSGDFYDYFWLSDGRLYFTVADVSGKGMTAALLMAKTSSLFRCLGKAIREPGALMGAINAELCETSVRGMFVTMVTGLYDPRSGDVRLVNAGNPPALLLDNGGRCESLLAQSPPLGILADAEFSESRHSLGGASLYLFTDGLGEDVTSPTGRPDVDRLARTFKGLSGLDPGARATAAVQAIHPPGQSVKDDLTLMVLSGAGTASSTG